MDRNTHRLVNWIEGMDVNYNHFQQLENYFIDRLGDIQAGRITQYNYGLLPSDDGKSDSSEFNISEQVTGKVEIKLRRCNALTAGGCRISYNPSHDEAIRYVHSFDAGKELTDSSAEYWDVILSVNPFKRVPVGIPNEDETPPRHPDSMEHYDLSIVAKGTILRNQLGFRHLVIGRIRNKGGRYEVDTNYIPPCTSMKSHADLLSYYEDFGVHLGDIERTSSMIISKIRNRAARKEDDLPKHIGNLCEEIMRYISSIYFIYRNAGKDMTPIHIVNYFSTLAHICFMGLNFIDKQGKEELLKYFYEWSDVTPGTFEDLLSNTLGIIYEHDNIRVTMLQIESFLKIISELWFKLSTLEYIGQRKDNIVISEKWNQPEQVKTDKSGWSILD